MHLADRRRMGKQEHEMQRETTIGEELSRGKRGMTRDKPIIEGDLMVGKEERHKIIEKEITGTEDWGEGVEEDRKEEEEEDLPLGCSGGGPMEPSYGPDEDIEGDRNINPILNPHIGESGRRVKRGKRRKRE